MNDKCITLIFSTNAVFDFVVYEHCMTHTHSHVNTISSKDFLLTIEEIMHVHIWDCYSLIHATNLRDHLKNYMKQNYPVMKH